MDLPWLAALSRFMLDAGLVLAFGQLLCESWLAPPSTGRPASPWPYYAGLGLVALGTGVEIANMLVGLSVSGLSEALQALGALLGNPSGSTSRAFWVRITLVVILTLWRLVGRAPKGLIAAWVAGALLTVSLTMDGHAIDWGWRSVFFWLNGIHTLCAAAWLGGLALLWLRLPRLSRPPEAVQRFSRMATVAFPAAVLCGLLIGYRHIPAAGLGAMLGLPYGRILLVKIGLVLVVLALAGLLRTRLLPGWQTGRLSAGEFRRPLTFELAIAIAILVATALITQLSPEPMDMGAGGPGMNAERLVTNA